MNERTLSPKQRVGVIACLTLSAVARVALLFRSNAELTVRPYLDDAYYVFSIARNLAAGYGLTVDGVHPTNGLQPLIGFLYTPLFWIAVHDSWLAVRLSILLNALILVASGISLIKLMRKLTESLSVELSNNAVVLTTIFWSLSIQNFNHTTNGLETGLYSLCLIILAICFLDIRNEVSPWKHVRLGLLMGITVLARIDSAPLVALLLLFELREVNWRSVLIQAAIAFIITLPWWLYNVTTFGSLMPTSGQAENIWPVPPGENLYRLLAAVTDISLVLGYLPYGMGMAGRSVAALIIIGALALLLRHTGVRRYVAKFDQRFFPFALFALFLIVYYTFFFKAPHFIPRYLQPIRIMWLVIAALLLTQIWHSPLSTKSLRYGLVVALTVSIGFGVDRYRHNFDIASEAEFYDVGAWAKSISPQKVTMLQSGVAGFVSSNVTNLDGKVNAEALRAHQHDSLAEYIRREHFTYLVDWKPFVDDIRRMTAAKGLYYDSIGFIGRVEITKLRE